MVLVSLFLSTTALFCFVFFFLLDSRPVPGASTSRRLGLCVRSGAAARRGARGRRRWSRSRSAPGQPGPRGIEALWMGTEEGFGHGSARGMRAGAAGLDGDAGWEGAGASVCGGEARGGSWPARLPHERLFRPWGRAPIPVSVNSGQILNSLIVKKKNPKQKQPTLRRRVAAQSSVPGW